MIYYQKKGKTSLNHHILSIQLVHHLLRGHPSTVKCIHRKQ